MAADTTVNLLKALADPTRLDIVRRLVAEQDCGSCTKISDGSLLSQPAMSHHFNKLVEAGVILEQKSGKEKLYTLNKKLLAASGIDPCLL